MFQTTDLYQASALKAHGHPYQGAVQCAPGRVAFVFADPNGAVQDAASLYTRHRMRPVQPGVFVEALFQVRDDLHRVRDGR